MVNCRVCLETSSSPKKASFEGLCAAHFKQQLTRDIEDASGLTKKKEETKQAKLVANAKKSVNDNVKNSSQALDGQQIRFLKKQLDETRRTQRYAKGEFSESEDNAGNDAGNQGGGQNNDQQQPRAGDNANRDQERPQGRDQQPHRDDNNNRNQQNQLPVLNEQHLFDLVDGRMKQYSDNLINTAVLRVRSQLPLPSADPAIVEFITNTNDNLNKAANKFNQIDTALANHEHRTNVIAGLAAENRTHFDQQIVAGNQKFAEVISRMDAMDSNVNARLDATLDRVLEAIEKAIDPIRREIDQINHRATVLQDAHNNLSKDLSHVRKREREFEKDVKEAKKRGQAGPILHPLDQIYSDQNLALNLNKIVNQYFNQQRQKPQDEFFTASEGETPLIPKRDRPLTNNNNMVT